MHKTILEPEAHDLTNGRFGTCFNGQTYQIDAITTFRDWQYAAFGPDRSGQSVTGPQLPAPLIARASCLGRWRVGCEDR